MPIPDYQSLMLPLLRNASNQETTTPIVAEKIGDELGLSEDERSQLLPSGKQRLLHNRIHWAKFYLSKAGLVHAPKRGRFITSDLGLKLLSTNPTKIDNEVLLQFAPFKEFIAASTSPNTDAKVQNTTVDKTAATIGTPEEKIDEAYTALHSVLRSDLLTRILDASPSFFESLIVELLVAMGYGGSHQNAAAKLGGSGDGGVDGVINEDRLGLDRVYIQAKRWAITQSVGRPEVQAFLGSLVGLGAAKGVFVTTSSFSGPAVAFVENLKERIVLIDGPKLADLMIEHNVGVRVSRVVEFKRLDEDFFSDEE